MFWSLRKIFWKERKTWENKWAHCGSPERCFGSFVLCVCVCVCVCVVVLCCLCVRGCGAVMTVSPCRGDAMLPVAQDYISDLLCDVTQWSPEWWCHCPQSFYHSREPAEMKRVGVWALDVQFDWLAFAQGRGSCWAPPQKRGAVFIGLVFRDSPSGSVLFKSIVNSNILLHTALHHTVYLLFLL